MTMEQEYLEGEVVRLQGLLNERTRQYQSSLKTIEQMERVISNGARLSTHVAYLCSTLPERSTDIEQAADQLHALLTSRQPDG